MIFLEPLDTLIFVPLKRQRKLFSGHYNPNLTMLNYAIFLCWLRCSVLFCKTKKLVKYYISRELIEKLWSIDNSPNAEAFLAQAEKVMV